jgi:hypothetical protein
VSRGAVCGTSQLPHRVERNEETLVVFPRVIYFFAEETERTKSVAEAVAGDCGIRSSEPLG